MHPDDEHYDEWLDMQAAIGSSLDADHEAISDSERNQLAAAVRHALGWLDVPSVLHVVADTIEQFDLEDQPDDDLPF